MIVVVVRTRSANRTAEALRAAIGLGLRGDPVDVVLCAAPLPPDRRIERALATLEALGRPALPWADLPRAIARASVVEVWS